MKMKTWKSWRPGECEAVLSPDPFHGKKRVMVGQPPPLYLEFPEFETLALGGRIRVTFFRKVKNIRADHHDVIKALYARVGSSPR